MCEASQASQGVYFYPRSHCGERPGKGQFSASGIGISIHALLAESDPRSRDNSMGRNEFLSTLSLRRATYFSGVMRQNPGISIHALLAESDQKDINRRSDHIISIHALLAESDLWVLRKVPILGIFLSTLSLRRATRPGAVQNTQIDISIHALLAESDGKSPRRCVLSGISIHALLAESDRGAEYLRL